MGSSQRLQSQKLQSPFFVGVIGHRHLNSSELPRIKEKFDTSLDDLLRLLPNTRITLLTALAAGADRLIFSSKLRDRVRICGVLPMALDHYRNDFAEGHEREEFEAALQNCDEWIIVPQSPDVSSLIGEARNLAYQNCGRWISDKSNILIGIWNGDFNNKTGGTGDIVHYRTQSVLAKAYDFSIDNDFVHIKAANGSEPSVESCACPGDKPLTRLDREAIKNLNRLNSLIQIPEISNATTNAESYLEQMDTSAVALKRRYLRDTTLLIFLGLLSANAASLTFNLDNINTPYFLSTCLLFIVTFASWRRFLSFRHKLAYEMFRFVAEVLRVQIWWDRCQISKDVQQRIVQRYDFEGAKPIFISNVLLNATIASLVRRSVLPDSSSRSFEPPNRKEELSYIEEQLSYLLGINSKKGAITRNRVRLFQFRLIAWTLISSAIALFLFNGAREFSLFTKGEIKISHLLINSLFTLCWTGAAVTVAVAEAGGYAETIRRFEMKRVVLESARQQLDHEERIELRREIISRVGYDSISECSRWFQMRSDRHLRPFQ